MMSEIGAVVKQIPVWSGLVGSLFAGLVGVGATYATVNSRLTSVEQEFTTFKQQAQEERQLILEKLDQVGDKLTNTQVAIARVEERLAITGRGGQ